MTKKLLLRARGNPQEEIGKSGQIKGKAMKEQRANLWEQEGRANGSKGLPQGRIGKLARIGCGKQMDRK
ncbi:MAG: hypothetical protein HFH39_02390 [Lachnospiraceae bacterium]|nr:hypothetical protein [Lachnospiraceae bacterium]